MKTIQRPVILIIILILGTTLSSIQAQSIQEQFEKFREDASKWEGYTMVKHHELDDFWKIVSDTLSKNQSVMSANRKEINSLSARIDSLGMALQQTKDELQASEDVNATIGFLGIQVNKVLYNLVVWVLIGGLCAAIAILYMMYGNSNKVTRATKKDFSKLATEFGEYKEKATKKQISLKRELQTAINTLEDNRIKVSQKLGYNKDSSRIS